MGKMIKRCSVKNQEIKRNKFLLSFRINKGDQNGKEFEDMLKINPGVVNKCTARSTVILAKFAGMEKSGITIALINLIFCKNIIDDKENY
jgi:hypothetical protein